MNPKTIRSQIEDSADPITPLFKARQERLKDDLRGTHATLRRQSLETILKALE